MGRSSPIQTILRSAGLPAVAVIAMGFFGYYALLGPNGILAYKDFRQQVAEKSLKYQQLDKRRAEVRNLVQLLDPRGADPDLVDELARRKLNVVGKDELILVREAK
ncbi:MAG: septum formation initiator family protein [Sphingomonas sp.]